MEKVIQTRLIDGTPLSMRIIEILNWSGISLTAFRSNLSKFKEREELSNPCVYFLIEDSEESIYGKRIYIGQTANFKKRLRGHMKREWNQCILFTSNRRYLTKTHVEWLEAHFYNDFSDFGYVSLENDRIPKKSGLPESDESYLSEYSNNVYLILSTLGVYIPNIKEVNAKKTIEQHPGSVPGRRTKLGIKEVNTKKTIEQPFHMSDKVGMKAYMKKEQGEYIVLKGSVIREERFYSTGERKSYREGHKRIYRLRDSLLKDGFLVEQDNGLFLLKKDVPLPSGSMAADFCAGWGAGSRSWKNKDGKTLVKVEEEEI